jgi:hypothetical protein
VVGLCSYGQISGLGPGSPPIADDMPAFGCSRTIGCDHRGDLAVQPRNRLTPLSGLNGVNQLTGPGQAATRPLMIGISTSTRQKRQVATSKRWEKRSPSVPETREILPDSI